MGDPFAGGPAACSGLKINFPEDCRGAELVADFLATMRIFYRTADRAKCVVSVVDKADFGERNKGRMCRSRRLLVTFLETEDSHSRTRLR